MPQAPAIDNQASDFAFALGAQFPELAAEELTISEEPDAEFLKVEWDGWTALFPQSEAASRQLKIMNAVMPHLRGFVSPSVPLWEVGSDAADWKQKLARRPANGRTAAATGADRRAEPGAARARPGQLLP